jgi:predicted NBD/HSP70 family sugar kinase
VPLTLQRIANRILLDGDELRKHGTNLSAYYKQIHAQGSSVATATAGLGMSRLGDPTRALVTIEEGDRAWLAFGPSAGLVLGVSVGSASIRAAIVDANGWTYHERRAKAMAGQLATSPGELFNRIKSVGEEVFDEALKDKRLQVQGSLPFLGIAVSWPAPLDEDKIPHSALSHTQWGSRGNGIDARLARHLGLPERRSHAVNDAAAAALAVVFDYTRARDYRKQVRPRLFIVVRIGGGIGAAAMGVERSADGVSGWMTSRIVGGDRELAGELGHTPINPATLHALAASRPAGCPELEPVQCSCAEGDELPDHVEAYASGPALAGRFASEGESKPEALRRVLADPGDAAHKRAFEDIGVLVGDALVPSVLMFNPSRITLTGRLSIPEVRKALELHLEELKTIERVFGVLPNIRALSGHENDYIGVRGAALAVFREHVHRRLNELYGEQRKLLPQGFAELTDRIDKCPWS